MRKTLLIISCVAFVWTATYGQQRHVIEFENKASNKVEIFLGGKVTIKGHSKNEIVIESPDYKPTENRKTPEEEEVPDKAKGLKSLNDMMVESSTMGLSIEEGASTVQIEDMLNRGRFTYNITLPDKVHLKFTRVDNKVKHDINISDLNGEVNLEVINGNLILSQVSGPIIATTVNGEMKVTYNQLNGSKPNSFTSVNGDLDISLPNNINADVAISTVNGRAYTDFEIDAKSEAPSLQPVGSDGTEVFTLAGKINEGGMRINFSTVNGNIYLRKK